VNVCVDRNDFGLPLKFRPEKRRTPSMTDLVKAHKQDAVSDFTADPHQFQQFLPGIHRGHATKGIKPSLGTFLPF
jgi:hypothetical protein